MASEISEVVALSGSAWVSDSVMSWLSFGVIVLDRDQQQLWSVRGPEILKVKQACTSIIASTATSGACHGFDGLHQETVY
jgi:hypothetical protein